LGLFLAVVLAQRRRGCRAEVGRSQYEGKKGPCRVPLGEPVGGRGERALAAPCPEAQAGSGRVKGGGDVSLRDMGV
jgi:hypothetical protein